jgi:Fis family transcriptional regulator, factor for inversion stimulation protein
LTGAPSERSFVAVVPSSHFEDLKIMPGELDALISQMRKGGILYTEAVREFRKAFIAEVLRQNNGNQSKSARELRMHRNTLTRIGSALGLDVRATRPGSRRPPGREPSLSAVRNRKISR